MLAGRLKRPRHPNQLAKLIVDIATGEVANDSMVKTSARRVGGSVQGRLAVSVDRRRISTKLQHFSGN